MITCRLTAVAELASPLAASPVNKLKKLLSGLPDLERALARVHYGRSTPSELFALLRSLDHVATYRAETSIIPFESSLLQEQYESLERLSGPVKRHVAEMNETAALANRKEDIFAREAEMAPKIRAVKMTIRETEMALEGHLVQVREILKRKDIEYRTISQIEVCVACCDWLANVGSI